MKEFKGTKGDLKDWDDLLEVENLYTVLEKIKEE